MPVNISEANSILLEGVIVIEDVDELIAAVRDNPGMPLDLSGCEHLHTAALQYIMLEKPRLAALPPDPFWSNFLLLTEEQIDEDNTAG